MSVTVNMLEAKSQLSRLVEAIEVGRESEIIIARNGRPVVRLMPLEQSYETGKRIGVAKGQFVVPNDIDLHNVDIARLFNGETL